MLRLLLSLMIALSCTGCFVFDELQAGREIMDAHTPNRADAKDKDAPATASGGAKATDEPGQFAALLDSAKAWWDDASEPAPVERDPDDSVVNCKVGDRTQFTRKSDCQVRGGQVL